jgi:hypothetical protein
VKVKFGSRWVKSNLNSKGISWMKSQCVRGREKTCEGEGSEEGGGAVKEGGEGKRITIVEPASHPSYLPSREITNPMMSEYSSDEVFSPEERG